MQRTVSGGPMKRERYQRLVKILNSGDYKVDIKNLQLLSLISRKSKLKETPMVPTKPNRKNWLSLRLLHEGTRYYYAMHEIFSVYLGKYIVGMRCAYLDGNHENIHPSNFYWSDVKGGKRPDHTVGKSSIKSKLTEEQIKEIRETVLSRNCHVSTPPLDELAKKYGVSRSAIVRIRGKEFVYESNKRYLITKNNRV